MTRHDPLALAARDGDRDRYLAALLAPSSARAELLALAAIAGEIGRVAERAREPRLAQIRLQWWRDAFTGLAEGGRTGHPPADALAEGLASRRLPLGLLLGLVDAQADGLSGEAPQDRQGLRSRLAKSEGALLALAVRALGGRHGAWPEEIAVEGGWALGLARLLHGLPRDLARGQLRLPADLMARHGVLAHDLLAGRQPAGLTAVLAELAGEVRAAHAEVSRQWRSLPADLRPALLPVTVAPLYLAGMDGTGPLDLARERVVPPLRRLWRIVGSHWSGRLA